MSAQSTITLHGVTDLKVESVTRFNAGEPGGYTGVRLRIDAECGRVEMVLFAAAEDSPVISKAETLKALQSQAGQAHQA